jgi:hypothetical protein
MGVRLFQGDIYYIYSLIEFIFYNVCWLRTLHLSVCQMSGNLIIQKVNWFHGKESSSKSW